MSLVDLEPTNPEDVHSGLTQHSWAMENVQPEDSEDTRVCVGVGSILGQGHDMRPVPHVHTGDKPQFSWSGHLGNIARKCTIY